MEPENCGMNAPDGQYWKTGDCLPGVDTPAGAAADPGAGLPDTQALACFLGEAQDAPQDAVGDCLPDVPVSASDEQLMSDLQAVVGCPQELSPHMPSALSGEVEG